MKINEQSLRDLWDTIKLINICIMAVTKEERENRAEEYLKTNHG